MARFLGSSNWLLVIAVLGCGGMAWLAIDPRVRSLLENTALLVAGVEMLAIPLGVLLALVLAKTDLPGLHWAWLLVVTALFVPLYIVAGAWDAGFGIQGWHTLATNPHLAREPLLSGWRAAVWIHAMAAVPWVALIVAAGLRTVEAELEEDAVLRMPAWQVLLRVTLRRSAAAIIVAAAWVAMVVAAEISVTDLFQVRTFAEEVYTEAALGAFDFSAATDGTISVRNLWYGVALSALVVTSALAFGHRFFDELVHAPEQRPWIWRIGTARWPAAVAMWACLLVVVGVPIGNLVYKAGVRVAITESVRVRSWSAAKLVERVATAPAEFRAELWQSAQIGAAAATAALMIAAPLAFSMRGKGRIPWKKLLCLALMMAVPGPILGIAMIRLLNRPPDSAFAGIAWLYDTNFAPWLVQTIRALPLVTLVLWPALASVPQSTLDTAALDGIGWWRRLALVALPQRWPAVAAAWLVGMAVAVGELAATILVVPPGPTTISVRVFSLLHYGVDDRVAAICLVLCAALALVVAIAAAFARMKPVDLGAR